MKIAACLFENIVVRWLTNLSINRKQLHRLLRLVWLFPTVATVTVSSCLKTAMPYWTYIERLKVSAEVEAIRNHSVCLRLIPDEKYFDIDLHILLTIQIQTVFQNEIHKSLPICKQNFNKDYELRVRYGAEKNASKILGWGRGYTYFVNGATRYAFTVNLVDIKEQVLISFGKFEESDAAPVIPGKRYNVSSATQVAEQSALAILRTAIAASEPFSSVDGIWRSRSRSGYYEIRKVNDTKKFEGVLMETNSLQDQLWINTVWFQFDTDSLTKSGSQRRFNGTWSNVDDRNHSKVTPPLLVQAPASFEITGNYMLVRVGIDRHPNGMYHVELFKDL